MFTSDCFIGFKSMNRSPSTGLDHFPDPDDNVYDLARSSFQRPVYDLAGASEERPVYVFATPHHLLVTNLPILV